VKSHDAAAILPTEWVERVTDIINQFLVQRVAQQLPNMWQYLGSEQ
jgi:hypothetical protein